MAALAGTAGSASAQDKPPCGSRRSSPFNVRKMKTLAERSAGQKGKCLGLKEQSRLVETHGRSSTQIPATALFLGSIFPVVFVSKREVKNYVISPPTPFWPARG